MRPANAGIARQPQAEPGVELFGNVGKRHTFAVQFYEFVVDDGKMPGVHAAALMMARPMISGICGTTALPRDRRHFRPPCFSLQRLPLGHRAILRLPRTPSLHRIAPANFRQTGWAACCVVLAVAGQKQHAAYLAWYFLFHWPVTVPLIRFLTGDRPGTEFRLSSALNNRCGVSVDGSSRRIARRSCPLAR